VSLLIRLRLKGDPLAQIIIDWITSRIAAICG
jgi:hypothetical protein